MERIKEDIKNGKFKQVYLLFGEETYLINQYKMLLKNALITEGDTMNFSRFEGKDTDPEEVIALAETMPFFADRRVILLENTGFFKKKTDVLADYLSTLPDYLVLIFAEDEVDQRGRMAKAVQKIGRVVEFKRQDDKTLMTWVLRRIQSEGKKIRRPDMECFLEKTGNDMETISMELEKLLCYTMGREVITRDDIEAVCTTLVTNRIFEMIRAVTEKNQKRAMERYYDLLTLQESPRRILSNLAYQFQFLLQIHELLAEHADVQTMARRTGKQAFVVKKAIPLAGKYRKEELEQAISDCLCMEEDVKTGKLADALSVELLITRYSSGGRPKQES